MSTKKYAATLIRSPCQKNLSFVKEVCLCFHIQYDNENWIHDLGWLPRSAFIGPVTISKTNQSGIILPGFIVQTNMPKGIF